jgi:hypothetical protein
MAKCPTTPTTKLFFGWKGLRHMAFGCSRGGVTTARLHDFFTEENLSMSNQFSELFQKCIEEAKILKDGHFTLMKFTTNWRAGFGTPTSMEHVQEFHSGESAIEAMKNALYYAYAGTGKMSQKDLKTLEFYRNPSGETDED